MKKLALGCAEVLLLFAALFYSLPYVPSHEIERLPLWPGAAYAVALFTASRLIRWRESWWVAPIESAMFLMFVWGSNEVANLLHSP